MELAIIPRCIIRKYFHEDSNQIHANILMTSVLVIVLFILLSNYHIHLSLMHCLCISQEILNMPCPGCGVTRSILALVDGNILAAWNSNPAGLFLFVYVLAQIPLRIIALKYRTAQIRIFQISQIGSNIVFVVLIMVWLEKLIQ